jgi:hypothetical protein
VNRSCSKCSRQFRTNIDLSAMSRETIVMYCGVCPTGHVYAVCEDCSSYRGRDSRIRRVLAAVPGDSGDGKECYLCENNPQTVMRRT